MTMKIYTKTGDRGETGLFGGGRVGKDHVRVDAYGEVDELNSVIGVAIAQLGAPLQPDLGPGLREVQADLFVVGANLATPAEGGRANPHVPVLDPARITALEAWIDAAEGGQVILTSPKETDVRIHGGGLPRWSIRDGVIRPG